MEAQEKVLYEVRDNIGYVTINNPERFNTTSHAMYELFYKYLKQAHDDPEVRACIMSANGDHFTYGDDISGMDGVESEWSTRVYGHWADQSWADWIHEGEEKSPAQSWCALMLQSHTVYICACQGMNVSPDITYPFDYVVASEDAKFAQCDILVGQSPVGGSTFLLPFITNRRVALETFLDYRPVTAEELFRRGIINKVVPREQLLSAAEAFAKRVVAFNPKVVGLFKKLTTRAQMNVDEQMRIEQMFGGFCHKLPGAGMPFGDWLEVLNYPEKLLEGVDLTRKYLHQDNDKE